jgi:hypothetical protein
MKRIDNRRVLASGTSNTKVSSHWPKVLLAGSIQNHNKENEMSYAQKEDLIPLGDLTLNKDS